MQINDTIAAIATPQGVSATGVIRVSGNRAIELTNKIFKGKPLVDQKSHTIHFGRIIDANKQIIDEVVVALFRNPKSYTGENVCEISCHGSPFVLQKVMERLIEVGVRQAQPGEFTKRAFLNGKIDLAMAEAVGDLIASESNAAHQSAIFQLKGGISSKIKELRSELVSFASLLELELDFSEEDVEFADRTHFIQLLNKIIIEVQMLIDSFKTGKMIKNGVSVAIVGRPNAGKSTLLNLLLSEEKAIVSSIAGTTRDIIEDVAEINGVVFRFIDTAGIRETTNEIETIGIKRALDRVKKAHLVIYLFDVNEVPASEIDEDVRKLEAEVPVVVVGNKIDLWNQGELAKAFPIDNLHFISSMQEQNIDELKKALVEKVGLSSAQNDYSQVTNMRHYNALIGIKNATEQILNGMENGLYSELIVQDIKIALEAMGEITGQVTNDEILGTIFSKFCIGK